MLAQQLLGDIEPRSTIEVTHGEKSHGDVQRFWTLVEQSFLPALAKAAPLCVANSYADITAAYPAHRAVIEEIVKQTNDDNAATEAEAPPAGSGFSPWVSRVFSHEFVFVIVVRMRGVAKGISHNHRDDSIQCSALPQSGQRNSFPRRPQGRSRRDG